MPLNLPETHPFDKKLLQFKILTYLDFLHTLKNNVLFNNQCANLLNLHRHTGDTSFTNIVPQMHDLSSAKTNQNRRISPHLSYPSSKVMTKKVGCRSLIKRYIYLTNETIFKHKSWQEQKFWPSGFQG